MKTLAIVLLIGTTCFANDWYFEAKGGYFRPESHVAKKIYGEGWPHFEVDASYELSRDIELWGSVGYLFNNGKSLGTHESANVWILPLTLGSRYVYHFEALDFYVGVGPRYFFYHEHAHSEWVKSQVSKNAIGGAALGGLRFEFLTHGVLDFFADYGYCKIKIPGSKPFVKGHTFQIGGWSVGIGVGYKL